MPTVSELAHETELLDLVVAAGSAGLARQVSRVVRLSPERLDSSLHSGDLVLVSLAEWDAVDSQAAAKLLCEVGAYPIAGVVVGGAAYDLDFVIAGSNPTPILVPRRYFELDQMQALLLRWLAERQIVEERLARELNAEFVDLVHAGADAAEVLEHLSRLTGKPALLHDARGKIQSICQPTRECFSDRELRAAIIGRGASAAKDGSHVDGLRQWRGVSADELPLLGLTRLSAAWPGDGPVQQFVSLLGRPAAVTQRDRAAISASVLALSQETARLGNRRSADAAAPEPLRPVSLVGAEPSGPADVVPLESSSDVARFAVAVDIPPDANADQLRQCLAELMGSHRAVDQVDDRCVVGVFTMSESPLADWERQDLVHAWHAELTARFGAVSLGYSSVHTGSRGLHRAVLHARQALIAGARWMGEGHACGHGDVYLRSFLSRTNHLAELNALQETLLGPLIAHDRVEQVKLLPTLEIYLDSACVTKHTAERLHIHRNSVVYRLRRIESVAQVDLGDADTRLLLQLALRASRVVEAAGQTGSHVARDEHHHAPPAHAELATSHR